MNNKLNQKNKNKKIKKNQHIQARKKKQERDDDQFHDNIMDLVSHSEQNNAEAEDQPTTKNMEEAILEERKEDQVHSNIKHFKLANGDYLYVIELKQYYKVRVQNEQTFKATISTMTSSQLITVNGKLINSYTTSLSFVFAVTRNDKQIAYNQYSANCLNQDATEVEKYLKVVNLKQNTLIRSSVLLSLQECGQPWRNLPECVDNNLSMMIIGLKNTGKSTLGEFLLNSKSDDCVLLDCDIGRNSCLQGCISLSFGQQNKKIWIGELTPLNNLQTYLRAVRYLFQYYREHWFAKKLVVNTMGYTTGLGQFLLYEIYQIIKPNQILVLQSFSSEKFNNLQNIIRNLRSGEYIKKLFVSNGKQQFASSAKINFYQNEHCFSKKGVARFERMFELGNKKVSNICDLLELIKINNSMFNNSQKYSWKERSKLAIYEQSRHGKEDLSGLEVVAYRRLPYEESVDMRLIVLGKMIKGSDLYQQNRPNDTEQMSSGLLQVSGLGFSYNGIVYFNQVGQDMIGVVSEGMDFQKGFYHVNQKQLIDLQLKMGRIGYLMVMSKGLGSKGMRNNPSKMS